MRTEEVEKLLVAFYDGRTTEEEEKALQNYFETQDVPEQFLIDKKIFLSFRTNCEAKVPAGLEAKLEELIDARAEDDKRFLVKNNTHKNWKWIGGIAASLLLLLALSFGVINLHDNQPKDTFTDPQDAYLALQSVFMEMSVNMNDGIDQLAESRQEVKKINEEIKEEIYN